MGKSFAAGRFVGKLDALALSRVNDGMIADNISAADGMDADLVVGAFAHNPVSAVPCVVIIIKLTDFGQ
ncbi:MAG: hypothetical protein JWL90_1797, partial [Chthoniobacteraceae bacterium]|nr:hypothetical protein [Chthoniobacteraceae bacterium]